MTGSERGGGAVSAPMAVLLLVLLAVVGLGIDGVRAAQGLAGADAVAAEAARAAGQAIDVRQLRRGTYALDTSAAVEAAHAYLVAAGVEGDVHATGTTSVQVRVRISRPAVLLGLIGRPEIVSEGSADAVLVPVSPAGGA